MMMQLRIESDGAKAGCVFNVSVSVNVSAGVGAGVWLPSQPRSITLMGAMPDPVATMRRVG